MDDQRRSELGEPDRLLRGARPSPRPEFELALERSLLGAARRGAATRSFRVAATGAGLTLALALLMVTLTALGLLPGAPGLGDQVKARDRCRTETVLRPQRVPEFVLGRRGADRIVYRTVVRRVSVKRCG